MIDGTAASRSTTKETGPDTRLCRYCVRQRATPTATGTAMAIARTADKHGGPEQARDPKAKLVAGDRPVTRGEEVVLVCPQAGQRKCQQEDADEKHEENDQQPGGGQPDSRNTRSPVRLILASLTPRGARSAPRGRPALPAPGGRHLVGNRREWVVTRTYGPLLATSCGSCAASGSGSTVSVASGSVHPYQSLPWVFLLGAAVGGGSPRVRHRDDPPLGEVTTGSRRRQS